MCIVEYYDVGLIKIICVYVVINKFEDKVFLRPMSGRAVELFVCIIEINMYIK